MRNFAMDQIETLDPREPWQEDMAKRWEASKAPQTSNPSEVYQPHLAGIWKEIGCAAEGAPYVIRGLLHRFSSLPFPFVEWQLNFVVPEVSALAAAFLDEERCPGAHGLTEEDKAKLKAIRDRDRDRSPPPASNSGSTARDASAASKHK
jgi:hypothetical protein